MPTRQTDSCFSIEKYSAVANNKTGFLTNVIGLAIK